MTTLLLGASGRTGRHIARSYLDAGRDLRSLGRSDPGLDGLTHLPGDVTETATLRDALDGVETVIAALASTNRDPVCSTVTAALIAAAGGRSLRYVTIGGAAVDAEGDAKGLSDKAVGAVMRLVVGRMLADRQREYAMLRASSLGWTMLRPPRLVDAPVRGAFVMSHDRPAAMQIARPDLALAVAEAAIRPDLIGRAPFVAEGTA